MAEHDNLGNRPDLDALIASAQKTRGWNNRCDLPQRAMLTAQCELIVIPAWLWRGFRYTANSGEQCELIRLCKRRAA